MANSSLKARIAALEALARRPIARAPITQAQAEYSAFRQRVIRSVGDFEAFVRRYAAGEATDQDRELAAGAPESMLPDSGEFVSFDEWVQIIARLFDEV
jgi:hypothetical protein